MITQTDITRRSPVSSYETREAIDQANADIARLYHRSLELLGRAHVLGTCMDLTNASLLRLIREELWAPDSGSIAFTPTSEAIYPTSLDALSYAEQSPEFGIMHARRAETQNVFADTFGRLRAGFSLARTTNNALFLARPDALVENDLANVIGGGTPYLAFFEKADIDRANITLHLTSAGAPFTINALRYSPMPAAGSQVLELIKYSSISAPRFNGGVSLTDLSVDSTTDQRTPRSFAGYLHFEPLTTTSLRLSVSSDLYLSSMGAIVVGMSAIVGELNVYARNSTIGFSAAVPAGKTRLSSLTINTDAFGGDASNVRVRLYWTREAFDRMEDHFLSTAATRTCDIPLTGATIYATIEFTSVNNTTPTVSSVVLGLS